MAKPDRTRQQLSIEQENAIALLIQGKSDREVAEVIGVSRQTVCEWRNGNAVFIAELNRRREELWDCQTERLRNLLPKAVDVLASGLDSKDPRTSLAVALHILKAVGLYGMVPRPGGPVTPEAVESAQRQGAKTLQLLRELEALM